MSLAMYKGHQKGCKGRKGQIAVEYIIMVGFLMALTLPIISLFLEYSRGSQDKIITTQAYNAARKIVDTAETVYSYGEPSRLSLSTVEGTHVITVEAKSNYVEISE